jgi:hypothetical protein
VINLKEAMNRWTQVTTTLDEHVYLGDPRLLDYPFVLVSTNQSFDLTETEKANLREFFKRGGFMFADNPEPNKDSSRGGAAMKQMFKDIFPNALFAPVPNDHPVYHSFFDFDGMPQGLAPSYPAVPRSNSGDPVYYPIYKQYVNSRDIPYLEGIFLNGDLVAVYSDKGYVVKWNDASNNEPQLRFGVNLIVYALTRGNTSAQRTFR